MEYPIVSSNEVSCTFSCPKKSISFRSPFEQHRKPGKPLSDEHKAKLKEGRRKAKENNGNQ